MEKYTILATNKGPKPGQYNNRPRTSGSNSDSSHFLAKLDLIGKCISMFHNSSCLFKMIWFRCYQLKNGMRKMPGTHLTSDGATEWTFICYILSVIKNWFCITRNVIKNKLLHLLHWKMCCSTGLLAWRIIESAAFYWSPLDVLADVNGSRRNSLQTSQTFRHKMSQCSTTSTK